MAIVKYSKPALSDIKDIRDYISQDSPVNARRFIKSIQERVIILEKYPEIGHLVLPERFTKLRQLLHKSYRIVYHFSNDVVTIITIHHQTRLIENIPVIKGYEE
ncbi:MAG: type II toxin-antitoxin system RelE/ParE family toxin [Flavobacterium sp.]|nr:type II toxin-antitoxin system RelE/ParE family toxin [Flavobacterium sp.]